MFDLEFNNTSVRTLCQFKYLLFCHACHISSVFEHFLATQGYLKKRPLQLSLQPKSGCFIEVLYSKGFLPWLTLIQFKATVLLSMPVCQ